MDFYVAIMSFLGLCFFIIFLLFVMDIIVIFVIRLIIYIIIISKLFKLYCSFSSSFCSLNVGECVRIFTMEESKRRHLLQVRIESKGRMKLEKQYSVYIKICKFEFNEAQMRFPINYFYLPLFTINYYYY